MQRPNFRYPPPPGPGGMGPRPGGFRSPTAGFDSGGAGRFSPPAWGFYPNAPPSFGPRQGQYCGSPNTPPRDFYDNNGNGSNNNNGSGSGGKAGRFYHSSPSPGHASRRPGSSPRYTPPYPKPPYFSQSPGPGQHMSHQGSPRTSTPFGATHGRERVTNDVEKYYSPSMLQDPWASLQPVPVADTQRKCSAERVTNTGRTGRYFN